MTIQETIKKSLKDAPVGDHCIHCNTFCDASAVLGMEIDSLKFARRSRTHESPVYLWDRRKRSR